MKTTATKTEKAAKAVAAEIARRAGIETLETRNSDRLDFHEIGVAMLEQMLIEAYERGAASR